MFAPPNDVLCSAASPSHPAAMADLVPLGMALYVAGPLEERTLLDGRARLSVQREPDAVAAQRRGIIGYLRNACDVHDPALFARIEAVQAIGGLLIDESLDDRAAIEAGWAMARELGALVLLRDGLHDASGAVLAAPQTPENDAADEDPPLVGAPSASQVATRLRVLSALAMRGLLEVDADRAFALGKLDALRDWIREQGLEAALDEDEQEALFEPTIGGMGRQQAIDATWRVEGAAVLAWALGLCELPPHDVTIDPGALFDAVGIGSATPSALTSPTLRDDDTLDAMREHLFSIHWRFVDLRIRPAPLDFAAVAARSSFGLVCDPKTLVEGDLAVDGVPITRADQAAVGSAASIARERHQAANYLIGDHTAVRYADVPTDT